MRRRALECVVVVAAVSCGQGPPNFDVPLAATQDADTSPTYDAAGGVRILSDVAAPRETDGRSSAPKDASLRERDGDPPVEGGHDAMLDGSMGHDAGPDVATRRDAATADAASADRASADRASDVATRDAATSDAAGSDTVFGDEASYDAEREASGTTDVDLVDATEADANANLSDGDACLGDCAAAADHLLISEVVTRPSGAEMIEITNPTRSAIDLSDYLLSDSHLYYKIATNEFTTASGSDFAARFPSGSIILPGQYVVVAIGNASGGSVSFEAAYGKKPDFELRPAANGATDDASVPNMSPAQMGPSIGATSSLTDGGEPVVLFFHRSGALVSDVDYLFFGAPTTANPVVDKTGIVVAGSPYHDDTPPALQRPVGAPAEGGSIHRCVDSEPDEAKVAGNGLTAHDETSESATKAFVLSLAASDRTPGAPPPAGLCSP